jgi:hypothetical protein
MSNFELATHIPMIIRAPFKPNSVGQSTDVLAEMVDSKSGTKGGALARKGSTHGGVRAPTCSPVYPTLAALAGTRLFLQGSLLPVGAVTRRGTLGCRLAPTAEHGPTSQRNLPGIGF